MADAPVVHIGENSPEHVAYRLMQDIMRAEMRTLSQRPDADWEHADRAYLLDLYAECLNAVRLYRTVPKKQP